MSDWHYRRVVVMECRLDRPLPDVTARVASRIALLAAEDVTALQALRPDLDPEVIRGRLARGHRCFAAWHEGRIIHAGWAATADAWIDFLDCAMPLEPGDVYQFDSYTEPRFRGAGVAGARVAWMARFFRDAHARRLLAVVWPGNPSAFRPLEKAGYRPCGGLRVIQWGRWRRVLHTPSRSRQ